MGYNAVNAFTEGRFSRPIFSDNNNKFSFPNFQIYILQNTFLGSGVPVSNPFEFNHSVTHEPHSYLEK